MAGASSHQPAAKTFVPGKGESMSDKGATISGAKGGKTLFGDHATAGSATITAEGGSAEGPGIVAFSDNADGGSATINLAGGHLDMTGSKLSTLHVDTLQMNEGTIEAEVGGASPCIKVATRFELSSATGNFAFTLATGASLDSLDPIVVMEADALSGMDRL